MKTCISSYSYSQLYRAGGFTRFDAIDQTKKFGCDGIELVLDDTTPDGTTPRDHALALTDYARKAGLEVPIYTTSANFLVEDPAAEVARVCKHIDIAAECGITLLRHDTGWNFFDGFKGVRTYKNVIEYIAPYIRQVAEYAAEKGVRTCSENHGRLMQDSDRMVELFTAVGNPNYGWLCDMGNFGGVDEDCSVAVSRLLEITFHVHAKDNFIRSGMEFNPGRGYGPTRGGNYRRATIFGHGNVPTFQILRAIKASGYDGFVSLEFEGMEDNMTALDIGTENLKAMIAAL